MVVGVAVSPLVGECRDAGGGVRLGGDSHSHDPVGLVVVIGGPSPGGLDPHGQAGPLVVLVDGALLVAGGDHDLVAPPVPDDRLACPVGVDHADQTAPPVVDPRVGPAPVLIGDLRDPTGQVGVVADPPEGGALCEDLAGLVVGVIHLHHAVGVHHPAHPPALVPLIAAAPALALHAHQPPRGVITVRHLPPVGGLQARDPVGLLVPHHGDAPAALMGQAHQPPRLPDVVHPAPGPRARPCQAPRGVEHPPAAGVVRHHQPLVTGRPSGVAWPAVVTAGAGSVAGAVATGVAGAVVGRLQVLEPQGVTRGPLPACSQAGEDHVPP